MLLQLYNVNIRMLLCYVNIYTTTKKFTTRIINVISTMINHIVIHTTDSISNSNNIINTTAAKW